MYLMYIYMIGLKILKIQNLYIYLDYNDKNTITIGGNHHE